MTEPTKRAPKDIAILSGPTDDGQGAKVVRIREGGNVSAGEIRPVREGEPLNQSELVRLHPLDPQKRVCAVEVLHAPQVPEQVAEQSRKASSGPARVSNAKYRRNWNVIFGSLAGSDLDADNELDTAASAASPTDASPNKDNKDWSLN
jgi:hypothetical protein